MIYSPKISDDLIPILYKIGKRERKPMTQVVDDFLWDSIGRYISSLGIPYNPEKDKVSDIKIDWSEYGSNPKK